MVVCHVFSSSRLLIQPGTVLALRPYVASQPQEQPNACALCAQLDEEISHLLLWLSTPARCGIVCFGRRGWTTLLPIKTPSYQTGGAPQGRGWPRRIERIDCPNLLGVVEGVQPSRVQQRHGSHSAVVKLDHGRWQVVVGGRLPVCVSDHALGSPRVSSWFG
jgi:hypothetical protein